MRLATWNVNSLNARVERVEEWLAYAKPDVLCLQETKLADPAFPALTFEALGYETAHHGQGRWNGVAILSRIGLEDVAASWNDGAEEDTDARILWASCGGVRVASVYVPNGRTLDDDHYRYKLRWLERLRARLESDHEPEEPIVIAGDFNIAPADDDVWSMKSFEGSTHVSGPERDALKGLEKWGLVDTFREAHPEAGLYTYWDYRAGMFHKRQGMRIDLLMASVPVAKNVSFALVDRQARKGKGPSDHAPTFIDFTLP